MPAVPPNNPLKLPFFVFGAVAGVTMIVVGVLLARWMLVIAGVVAFALSCPSIVVVRRGDNPWWVRAPLDYLRRR
jgi:hypothetical protein